MLVYLDQLKIHILSTFICNTFRKYNENLRHSISLHLEFLMLQKKKKVKHKHIEVYLHYKREHQIKQQSYLTSDLYKTFTNLTQG